MRKLIVAVILLFASICPMQAQTLDEIVSKHLDAMGGAGRLRAVQTMSMERVGVDPSKKTDTFAILRKRLKLAFACDVIWRALHLLCVEEQLFVLSGVLPATMIAATSVKDNPSGPPEALS